MERESVEKETGLISQKELCKMFSISRFVIYRAIKSGKIKPIKKGKENFFEKEAIDKWIVIDGKGN